MSRVCVCDRGGSLIPLFWTSGDVLPGQPYLCLAEAYVLHHVTYRLHMYAHFVGGLPHERGMIPEQIPQVKVLLVTYITKY